MQFRLCCNAYHELGNGLGLRIVELVDTYRTKTADSYYLSAADNAIQFVALRQEKFRQIGTVLIGDSR